jgi:hypothetical protein
VNSETGKVYTVESKILEAFGRGEKLHPVSARVAELVSWARKGRTQQLRNKRKAARRASR